MKTPILFFISFIFILTACSNTPENENNEIDLNIKSQELIKADNAFGLDIFELIYKDKETPTNFMISPLSLSMALSMAYNGAESQTKEQMAEALRINNFTPEEINQSYRKLIDELIIADPKVAMQIANSIWSEEKNHVEQSFLDVNTTFYDAEVKQCDFKNPQTLALINQWVSDKTHEKIPSILDEIPASAVLYLINAIYFNGSWTQEFNPKNTQEGSFEISKNNYVQTALMQRIDTLNYLSNETFSAIEMPYGDGKFNMMVLLPNYDKTVDDIIDKFTPENWEKWQNDFKTTNDVDILFPKFKIEFEVTLNKILESMGMKIAFTPNADFSNINKNKDIYISLVKHKTFVEVDEEGTEAAAVTIVEFIKTSIDPNEPQKTYFHCTRPFLFAITEKDTDAIMFLGKVGDPSNL